MNKKGIVKNVKQREKGYSIQMDDNEWYSEFGKCPVTGGAEVEFDWEWNDIEEPKYRNIVKGALKVIKEGAPVENKPSVNVLTDEQLVDLYKKCIMEARELLTTFIKGDDFYDPGLVVKIADTLFVEKDKERRFSQIKR